MQTSATISAHGTRGESAWQSPWVRAWIGLIVVVLMVNITMIYLAFTTSPGLVNADYYERGHDYEEHLMSRRARNPGWLMKGDIPATLRQGQEHSMRVFLVDRAGQPVDADSVTFYVYRPADARRDFNLPMRREAPGRYVVETSFPLPGIWDTLIGVRHQGDEYTLSKRVEVARQ